MNRKSWRQKVADNRSYRVYLVTENGYEHTEPIRAFTLRRKAEGLCRRLTNKHLATVREFKLTVWYEVVQIDLVTHDGCHKLHSDLEADKGR